MLEKWLEISVDVPNEFVEPVCQIFSKYSNNKIAIIESPTKNYNLNLIKVKCWIDYSSSNTSLELIDISIKLINYLHPIGEIQKTVVNENMWNKQEFSSISIAIDMNAIQRLMSNPRKRTIFSFTSFVILYLLFL